MAKEEQSLAKNFGSVWSRRKQIWRLVEPGDKRRFIVAVVLMAGVAYIETAIPFKLGEVLNGVLARASGSQSDMLRFAGFWLSVLAAAFVLKETLNMIRRSIVHRTTTRIERDMVVRVLGHLLKIDMGALAQDRVGTLQGRIARSVEGYTKFLKIVFTDAIPAVLLTLFVVGGGIWKDWRVGLLVTAVVPLAALITLWQVRSQKGIRLALMQAREHLDGTVSEQLGGLEYIRVAHTHRHEVVRVQNAAGARREQELNHHLAMSRFDWLKAVNENLFHIGVIGFALFLAARGMADYGQVLSFSLLFQTLMRPMKDIHRILDETYETSLQVSVLLAMLEQPVDQSFDVVTLRPPRLDGSVPLLECSDLVVEYDTPHGKRRVLDGVTLAINQGQTIGVAGPSGSGKSTWLRAMLRLLHPTSGEVLVGGVPIRALSREDIGKSIGYVSQIPFSFSGTVAENIVYGCGDVSREQIEEAARQAHIHEEILAMPRGYDTVLTERGGNLSGGQRQRIALARMFLKNPPVLILDEGTSALDNISERRVRAAIDHARRSHTVIMVAHRLSTLNETNRIFVFDKGQVIEEGEYNELIERNGVFAELARSAEAR